MAAAELPPLATLAERVQRWEALRDVARRVEHQLAPGVLEELDDALTELWGWYSAACEEVLALEHSITLSDEGTPQ